MPSVSVTGPDGKIYDFPDGTNKDQAISYFKKKGIGVAASPAAQPDELDTLLKNAPTARPTYGSEFLSAVSRGAKALGQLPKQLLTPHETYGATREQEVKMGPLGRAIYNVPADLTQSLENAEAARERSSREGEGGAGQALSYMENLPVIGNITRKAEEAGPGTAKFEPQTLGAVTEGLMLTEAPKLATEAGLRSVGALRGKARSIAQRAIGALPRETTRPLVEKYTKAAGEATEKQAEVTKGNARRAELQSSHQQGSPELGKRAVELKGLVKDEVNGKYAPVHKGWEKDPGEPLPGLLEHVDKEIMHGNPTKMAEFRTIMKESGGLSDDDFMDTYGMSAEQLLQQNPDLYEEAMKEANKPLHPELLKNLSSRFGKALARGRASVGSPGAGLDPDLYRAIKYAKDRVDTALQDVAERNGVGAQLDEAKALHRAWRETFTDKGSAVAQVIKRAAGREQLDPEFQADPFVTGKAANVAANKLRSLPTAHTAEANALADLGLKLREGGEELKGLGKPERAVEQPKAPTPEGLRAIRSKKAEETASKMEKVSKFGLSLASAGGLGVFLKTGNLDAFLTVPAFVGSGMLIGKAFDSAAFKDWVSSPTAADLADIEKLPDPAKARFKAAVQEAIEKVKPPTVSPAITRLIGTVGIVSSANRPPVQNRQEAIDRLNAPIQ